MQPVRVSPPPTHVPLSDREALDLVQAMTWYHAFELRPGLKTPGVSDFLAEAAADALKIPSDLRGKSALDVGAWDGPLTFELERRGAPAFALDIQDPTRVGFDVARRILQSNVTHYQGSVYQLPCEELHDLDIIAFRGVYYHLKYPILAFERIAAALKMGGTLHFEGEGLLNYAEDLDGKPVKIDFAALHATNAPICLIYPNAFKGASNWFIPTPACLTACMQAAGLEVKEMHTWTPDEQRPTQRFYDRWLGRWRDKRGKMPEGQPSGQRLYGYAVKIREQSEILEHPLY